MNAGKDREQDMTSSPDYDRDADAAEPAEGYWVADYQGALTELVEMGLGYPSARGVLALAGRGETVDIGCGQHVRLASDPAKFAISRLEA